MLEKELREKLKLEITDKIIIIFEEYIKKYNLNASTLIETHQIMKDAFTNVYLRKLEHEKH